MGDVPDEVVMRGQWDELSDGARAAIIARADFVIFIDGGIAERTEARWVPTLYGALGEVEKFLAEVEERRSRLPS